MKLDQSGSKMTSNKKRVILVFGNPLMEADSLALRILPQLRKLLPDIEFVELDGTESEEIARYGPDVTILDVAKGIEKPVVIADLDQLDLPRVVSMHDFDLAWNLKLLKKIGKIRSVKIVAVPTAYPDKMAIEKIKELLS